MEIEGFNRYLHNIFTNSSLLNEEDFSSIHAKAVLDYFISIESRIQNVIIKKIK
jgi:hypothetical protein